MHVPTQLLHSVYDYTHLGFLFDEECRYLMGPTILDGIKGYYHAYTCVSAICTIYGLRTMYSTSPTSRSCTLSLLHAALRTYSSPQRPGDSTVISCIPTKVHFGLIWQKDSIARHMTQVGSIMIVMLGYCKSCLHWCLMFGAL